MTVRASDTGACHSNEGWLARVRRTTFEALDLAGHTKVMFRPADGRVWTREVDVGWNEPCFEDAADLAERCEERCDLQVAGEETLRSNSQ